MSLVFVFFCVWFVVSHSWSQRVERAHEKNIFMSTRDDRKNGNWDLYIEVTFNSYFTACSTFCRRCRHRLRLATPPPSPSRSECKEENARNKWQNRINPSHQVNNEYIYCIEDRASASTAFTKPANLYPLMAVTNLCDSQPSNRLVSVCVCALASPPRQQMNYKCNESNKIEIMCSTQTIGSRSLRDVTVSPSNGSRRRNWKCKKKKFVAHKSLQFFALRARLMAFACT